MTNKLKKIILLIIKNTDEGDGASLKMINSSLNILFRDEKYRILFNEDYDLNSIISEFVDFKYLIINDINNYKITELGKNKIKLL